MAYLRPNQMHSSHSNLLTSLYGDKGKRTKPRVLNNANVCIANEN